MDNKITKEPIIIDGVDVLNCGYFSQFEGKTENACYIQPLRTIGSDVKIGFGSCNSSPNCYYKQLKRKEQECDQLQAELKKFKDMAKKGLDNYKDVGGCWGCGISFSFDELLKSYKALELLSQKQLAQLKAENNELEETFNNAIDLSKIYKKQIFKSSEKALKYFQTLQEIKEIAELKQKQSVFVGETVFEQILQKCEVIDD